MQELIPLQLQTIDGNAVETVSARELHSFLESRQDFSTWIKNRISEYDFVEHQDFITAPQKYGTANGGYATRNEYYVTLDMAKELSMVENNPSSRPNQAVLILMKLVYIKCISATQVVQNK